MNSALPGDKVHNIIFGTAIEDLNELEQYINDIWQFLPIPTAYVNPIGVLIDTNEKIIEFLKYSREELIGKQLDDIGPIQKMQEIREMTLNMGHVRVTDLVINDKNGNELCTDVFTFARKDINGQCIGFFIAFIDITKRKKTEEALRDSERIYRDLVDNALVGIYKVTLKGDYIYINEAMACMFEFDSAEAMVMEGVLTRYKNPKDRDRFIEAIKKQGKIVNYELDLVTKNGRVINTLANATLEGDIISGMMMDVTERMIAAETIAESYQQLKKMLDGTVSALASTAEKKDPYTAGHQRRVTQLAIAIGKKMGLSSDQIEGIRVAGTLHDIGKIYVPTEILSKPTVLTYVEYSIVKTHAQIGYEILKNIEFPWPVTTIVIQHHERLDGSGYPNALKENDIILEARILTVADVVEAMASHRPYRPAPGIETALDEIKINKGILYDFTVVDSCVELFLKDGFRFD